MAVTSTKPRILLTGASGFLGHWLAAGLRARGCAWIAGGRGDDAGVAFDLDRPGSAAAAVADAGADVVLHAAAMASMAACEADPAAAWRRNAEATAALAATGVRVVFVSTDLVFDGRAAPYGADAPPSPISAYGRSKVGGEEAVRAAGGVVVRVPLLFGRSFDGRRGATDMLRVARAEGRMLSLFVDEFRTPIHARDAARRLVEITADRDVRGVVHAAGPERLSRFELAERFARVQGWEERWWREARSGDPTRPPDVSLLGEGDGRGLEAMLEEA